jgi:hypothetical protein
MIKISFFNDECLFPPFFNPVCSREALFQFEKFMKPILCAIDLSESSVDVLRLAIQQSTLHNNSRVLVLYAYRLVIPGGKPIAEYRKDVEKRACEKFESFAKQFSEKEASLLEFRMEIGFLADRIEAYAEKDGIELVVISEAMANSFDEHQRVSLRDFIESLHIPLMIVPS